MKKFFFIFFICAGSYALAYGQENIEYKTAVKKMLTVSGSEKTFQMAIDQMLVMMRPKEASAQNEFWESFSAEMKQTSMNELLDMLLPVYQKHLTLTDINNLVAFYESPAGRKFAEKSPLIMQDSMHIGGEWGAKIGKKIAEKLAEKQKSN